MGRASSLDKLMDNYQNFDIGELQRNFELDRTLELIKRPVERYSYALMRAALNVFVQHYFANYLNSLVFDRVSFGSEVRNYVPQVWPHYLEDAQKTLTSAKISQLGALEFKDWGPEGANQFGAWHLLVFPEFKCNILLQISNSKSRLGAFEGLCFLENDQNALCELPTDRANTCHNLGPLHLQLIIDEMLEALGISPGSAMSAIKWQMS